MFKPFRSPVHAAVCSVLSLCAAAAHADAPAHITIPPGELRAALDNLSQQTGTQFLYDQRRIDSVKTQGVKNAASLEEAVEALLQGTALKSRTDESGAILVAPAASLEKIQTSELSPAAAAMTADEAPVSSVAESGVDEITVSARRRNESQKDVPLSIVARTGETLEKARVDDLSQLERLVPGMMYAGMSITPLPTIMLRGVGSFSTNQGVDTSVGIAIDGAVTTQTSALASDFSDIERIEVLRGPQGTLFGKNSSAGLVSIVTKDPSETWTGSFGMGTGSYNEVKLKGMVSGPLIGDTLLARVTLYSDKRDGYIYNIGQDRKVLDDDQRGARATFVYRPTDSARLRLSIFDVARYNDWSHSIMPARSVGAGSTPLDFQGLGPIAGPENDRIWTTGDGDIDYFTQTWGSTLQWDQQLGAYTLTSITSHLDYYWRQYWGPLTDGPAPYTVRAVNTCWNWNDQWTQELKIASPTGGKFDYVAGLYYYNLRFGAALDQLFIPSATGQNFNRSHAMIRTENYAAFAETNLHATDTVTFTAGTRWTHETKDFHATAEAPPPRMTGFLMSANPGTLVDQAAVENWSWRLGSRWEPAATQMYYVTAARGFKGPGFNVFPSNNSSQKVEPEVATTFEIGSKTSWLDNRLSANLAVFHSMFKNAQANAYAITTSSTSGQSGGTVISSILTNAGKVRTQGVELELSAAATENLTVNLIGSYIDGIFKEFTGGQCYGGQTVAQGCAAPIPATPTSPAVPASQDLSGTRLPFAPKLSGTLSADYAVKFPALPFDGFVRADYSWRDDVQYSYTNAPTNIEPAYGLLGATIGVQSRDGRYTASVYGKNLTDKFHVGGLGILSTGGNVTVTQQIGPDYQRIWGANFNYNF